ncbi:hypothetical protein [Paracoccus halophilus]|uniref:hypothetical protein n=1 Tax=Paracoccus halophilus TaxID=376733 RepID=UPI00111333C4|nr:hypothetical protein [Paracoccus halophilus]
MSSLTYGAGVAHAQMYLDNVAPGDGTIETQSGDWAGDSEIWVDASGQNAGVLPSDQIGILTESNNPVPSTETQPITLSLVGGDLPDVAGLQVDSGFFRINGGQLQSTAATLSLSVAAGSQLEVRSSVQSSGTINVSGPGQVIFDRLVEGAIDNSGNTRVRNAVDGSVVNRAGAEIALLGDVTGSLNNLGQATVAGDISGSVTNSGNLFVAVSQDGDDTDMVELSNAATGLVSVRAGAELSVDQDIDNAGRLAVTGTLNGRVIASGDSRTELVSEDGSAGRLNGDLISGGVVQFSGGTLDGDLTSNGSIEGSGTIIGNFLNTGSGSFSGEIRARAPGAGGTLQNEGTLVTGGDLTAVAVINDGELTVTAGDTLTAAVTNGDNAVATLNLDGTLVGGLVNAGGSTVNMGADAVITANVQNTGEMNIAGDIQGGLRNQGTVETAGDVTLGSLTTFAGSQTTVNAGDRLTSDGVIDNSGMLSVAGSLVSAGGIVNSDEMEVLGSVEITGTDPDDRLLNGNGARLTLDGAAITGDIVNDGAMTVISDAQITGDLTNNNLVTLDSTAGLDVTLTVNGRFVNNADVNGTGANTMRIETERFVNLSGTITNVEVIGDLENHDRLVYSEDSEFETGGLFNMDTGVVNVSATLNMNGGDVSNQGEFLLRTDPDSAGNLTGVDRLTNAGSGQFDIADGTSVSANSVVNQDDAELVVGGQLTSAGGIDNSASLTIAATGVVTGGLDNSGTVSMQGGSLTGDVQNDGSLTGTGTVIGDITNGTDGADNSAVELALDGEVQGTVVNYGTMTQSGTLDVQRLSNIGSLDIGGAGALISDNVVTNSGALVLAGELAGGLNNSGTIELNGGTISGDVTNRGTGRIEGSGTLTGGLTNNGALTTRGDLTVASLGNSGTLTVTVGSTLTSDAAVENRGSATITGTLEGGLDNSGTTELDGGTISRDVTNRGKGLIEGSGTLTRGLTNNGRAVLAGSVAGEIVNRGVLTVAAESKLIASTVVKNRGTALIEGRLTGGLNNGDDRFAATTEIDGGVISGTLTNAADSTVTGTGTIVRLDNAGSATLGGRVGVLANDTTGVLNTSAGTGNLRVSGLVNNGQVTVAAGTVLSTDPEDANSRITNNSRLTIAGSVHGDITNGDASNTASTVLSGGTVSGLLTNARGSSVSGNGTIVRLDNAGSATLGGRVGALENDATGVLNTSADTGNLRVSELVNNGRVTVAAGTVLSTDPRDEDSRITNNSRLTIAGRVRGNIVNGNGRNAASTVLSGGIVNGLLANARGSAVTGTGTITNLDNAGSATLGGRVGALENDATGVLNTSVDTGNLRVSALVNNGQVTVAAGTVLSTDPRDEDSLITNNAGLTIAGRVRGNIVNGNGRNAASTVLSGGIVHGRLTNAASSSVSGTGTIASLVNAGTATLGGRVTGNLTNQSGGTLGVIGTLSVRGALRNDGGAGLNVAQGRSLSVADGLTNALEGEVQLDGAITGAVGNSGSFTQAATGLLEGSLTTDGEADLAGRIDGDLIYLGGELLLSDTFSVSGDLQLDSNYNIAAGQRVTAGRTVVGGDDVELGLRGRLDGDLLNNGSVNVDGRGVAVSGRLTNDGVINLEDNLAGDTLRVGGLDGSGEYRLDIDVAARSTDRIVINGGAATGLYALELNFVDENAVLASDNRLTLMDVDEAFRAENSFDFSHSDLPSISERIVYSVEQLGRGGDVVLVSQTNPAIGALFGNVALTQSLIGSVINRPTSPFVTALAYEDEQKPCGVGSWGRVTGGHATADGSTSNGISRVSSEITADYYGMQVGTDLACFDDRFGGWDMAFGVLGGINRGDTNQPVYAIDPNNSRSLSGTLTSYNSTDFEQRYVGVYATATRGAFQADLQYRIEKTDFTIENNPVAGRAGLGLSETDFSSDAWTLSGSVSYGVLIGESGWAVVPTLGFAWSEMSTDSIAFDDGYRVIFDDSSRKIGFVGATLAKTFVQQSENSALSTFVTGTWYKDFADPTISVFRRDNDAEFTPQRLESENLGSYGEISIGANWIKVLGPKSRGRQLSAGARIDARYGDRLDSVGVSGQLRWQF